MKRIRPGATIVLNRNYSDDGTFLSQSVTWEPLDYVEDGDPKIARVTGELIPPGTDIRAGDILDWPDLPWRLRLIEDFHYPSHSVAVMRVGWLSIFRATAYRIGILFLHIKERLIMTAWVWGLGRRPRPGYPLTWRDVHIVRRLFGDE